MLHYLIRTVNGWFLQSQHAREDHKDRTKTDENMTRSLDADLQKVKDALGDSCDLVTRAFTIGSQPGTRAALVFIDGLVNTAIVNQNIIEPLLRFGQSMQPGNGERLGADEVRERMLAVSEALPADTLEDVLDGCLGGDTVLLLDGSAGALVLSSKGFATRAISEPSSESVIRGPREGFTENLRTNTMLLRRKIKSPALRVEGMRIGRKTRTPINLMYIEGLANPRLLAAIKTRLEAIKTDAILETGYIEQFIEDDPFSFFSTVAYSEKPDVVAAKMLEGRVAIIVDGTPFVLTAPMLMLESFQTAEDYYVRPYFATMLRILRYVAFAISILGPAVYVALTTFHQELIPTGLLTTMADAKEGTPFPAVIEALIMMVTYELLREAGLRLPRPVGQAISIVGALVMGEAAVSAGIVGAPVVIVIAITAVSSFVVPAQADAGAILRFVLLILSSVLGGYGITIGLVGVLVHLASLKSFGFPYLSPLAPVQPADLKDSIVRAPIWTMLTRPQGMSLDRKRKKEEIPGKIGVMDDRTSD